MAGSNRKKVLQQLSLSPDVRDELKKQAQDANLTVSMYVERMVLERKITKETIAALNRKPKTKNSNS